MLFYNRNIYVSHIYSSDFMIKVVDVDTSDSKTLSGHEAPVLSVALDPQEEFLVSSSLYYFKHCLLKCSVFVFVF